MPGFLSIDGSVGEGGGQILRTAVCLSTLQQRPVELHHIRAGRRPAGLAPQHLAVVRALGALCAADISGDEPGSQNLLFPPGQPVRAGRYDLDISALAGQPSAGSVTLLLQAILFPLALQGDRPSTITLTGGTHVRWSPCYQYLTDVYLPLLERIGIVCNVELGDWGWHPEGQGTLEATIQPAAPTDLNAMEFVRRGALTQVWALSAASNLPGHIIDRQRLQLASRLRSRHIKAEMLSLDAPSPGTGTVVFLTAQYEEIAAGFTAYGRIRYPAERVADDAFEAFDAFRGTKAALDPHLADQVILPLSLAGGISHFTTSQVTEHLQTVAWLVELFTGRKIDIRGNVGAPGEVIVL
ncbi:MAG: RNA 3'-terminal phosphate cyclase [Anaerolineae bacterium]